jgi:hypothetical protein
MTTKPCKPRVLCEYHVLVTTSLENPKGFDTFITWDRGFRGKVKKMLSILATPMVMRMYDFVEDGDDPETVLASAVTTLMDTFLSGKKIAYLRPVEGPKED